MLFGKNMKFREYLIDVLDFAPNQNIFENGFNKFYVS